MFEITEIFLQLGLAVLLGAIIGLEREIARKTAGMRTFALVSLGSCLFTIISHFTPDIGTPSFDPSRIAAQIVTGIGFLGGGLIILRQDHVQGLTTAAGLWVTAAIGMAIGYKLYSTALFTTFLSLAILIVLWLVEHHIVKKAITSLPPKEDDK